jgi:hypothetical protein
MEATHMGNKAPQSWVKRILAVVVIAAIFLAGWRMRGTLHQDPSAIRITRVVSNGDMVSNGDTVTVEGETSNTRYRLVCRANDLYSRCFFPESGKIYHVEVIGQGYAVLKEMDQYRIPYHNFRIELEEAK